MAPACAYSRGMRADDLVGTPDRLHARVARHHRHPRAWGAVRDRARAVARTANRGRDRGRARGGKLRGGRLRGGRAREPAPAFRAGIHRRQAGRGAVPGIPRRPGDTAQALARIGNGAGGRRERRLAGAAGRRHRRRDQPEGVHLVRRDPPAVRQPERGERSGADAAACHHLRLPWAGLRLHLGTGR